MTQKFHSLVYIQKKTKQKNPKKFNMKRYMYPNVHCSMIYSSQGKKQPNCPPADEWTEQIWYIHTMEQYSAIKKNEILPLATTWMDL